MVCFRFSQGSYFKLNGFESRYSYCENYEVGFLLLLKKHKKQTKKTPLWPEAVWLVEVGSCDLK